MKLTSMLAGAAVAALALTSNTQAPLRFSPTVEAEAAANVSVSLFYDRLADQGGWVRYRNDYVFIPNVQAGWRPYTLGHWVYTDRYGWTWVSDEPFGWATYHYGRWGYAEDIGWYWVPGRKWAPAWVSWRRNADYVVWAPLPPSRRGGADVSITVNARDVPDFYWIAVPTRQFLAPDIRVAIVTGDRDVTQVVRRTKFIGTPRVKNNVVINNVIDVNVIAKATGQKVRRVEVRETSNPQEAKATADQVTVFQGEISPDKMAKPKDVQDVTKVKKVKRGKNLPADETAPPENTTTAPVTNAPATGETAQPAPGKEVPPAAGATGQQGKPANPVTATTPPETPPAGQAEVPQAKPKKKATENQGTAPNTQPEAMTPPAANGQQSGTASTEQKKLRKPQEAAKPESGQGSTPSGTANAPTKQQGGAGETTGSTSKPVQKPGKGKKNQEACDPATNPDCKPAQ